jgi:4-amino-4-deoxy-L-arabinose transferase-like glycosyltransferase
MWCIMIGLKVFSDPVLGLRFYSAVCYLLLTLICGLFFRKVSPGAGLLAVGALGINMTPFLAHMVRAGDADSLYVLLFSVAMLSMMRIRQDHRFFVLCGLCFSLAFLTKSFHALMIAAIGGLFLLFTKQLFQIRLKEWGLFFLAILVPLGIWAGLRYRIDGTAFFVKMWETDVMGRTGGQLTSNPSPFWYYASYYFGSMSKKVQVYVWALVLVGAFLITRLVDVVSSRKKSEEQVKVEVSADVQTEAESEENIITVSEQGKKEQKKNEIEEQDASVQGKDVLLGFALWILLPFLAFSAVTNKLLWYQYPSVTALMIAAALAADRLWERFFAPSKWFCKALFACGLLFLFCWYYLGTFRVVNAQSYNEFQVLVRAVAGDQKAVRIMEEMDQNSDLVVLPQTPAMKDCRVYVDYDGTTPDWSQQDVFVAEAYGNYECANGGIFALYLDSTHLEKKGVAFVERETYRKEQPLYEDNPLIAATDGFLAFEIEY